MTNMELLRRVSLLLDTHRKLLDVQESLTLLNLHSAAENLCYIIADVRKELDQLEIEY